MIYYIIAAPVTFPSGESGNLVNLARRYNKNITKIHLTNSLKKSPKLIVIFCGSGLGISTPSRIVTFINSKFSTGATKSISGSIKYNLIDEINQKVKIDPKTVIVNNLSDKMKDNILLYLSYSIFSKKEY